MVTIAKTRFWQIKFGNIEKFAELFCHFKLLSFMIFPDRLLKFNIL